MHASTAAEGVIYAPIDDSRVPFTDARDIAAVAVEVLLHPDAHVSKKYVLTGGTAVGYADVAAALAEATGRGRSPSGRSRWRGPARDCAARFMP